MLTCVQDILQLSLNDNSPAGIWPQTKISSQSFGLMLAPDEMS